MILRGWKAICAEFGGISSKGARRLMDEEGFPVAILGGRPMTTDTAIAAWVEARIDLKRSEEEATE